ncbi:hypothetical protein ACFL2D_00105 [Patescibacteria group bacterium]
MMTRKELAEKGMRWHEQPTVRAIWSISLIMAIGFGLVAGIMFGQCTQEQEANAAELDNTPTTSVATKSGPVIDSNFMLKDGVLHRLVSVDDTKHPNGKTATYRVEIHHRLRFSDEVETTLIVAILKDRKLFSMLGNECSTNPCVISELSLHETYEVAILLTQNDFMDLSVQVGMPIERLNDISVPIGIIVDGNPVKGNVITVN